MDHVFILSDMPSRKISKRIWLYVIAPIAIVVAIAVGAFGYLGERGSREGYIPVGNFAAKDRVDLTMVTQRVETSTRELVLQLRLNLAGDYAAEGDPTKPIRDLTVDIPSANVPQVKFPANEQVTTKEIRLPFSEGVASDFPFDSYRAQLAIESSLGSSPANVTVAYIDHDPSFMASVNGSAVTNGIMLADLTIKRSTGTILLAWFQVIAMWALALSVFVAAVHIMARKLGLVWPAMGWMAATLFALVGFRNAMPGLPPIGSVIDYCAFFWAEMLVSLSLVLVVVKGLRRSSQ